MEMIGESRRFSRMGFYIRLVYYQLALGGGFTIIFILFTIFSFGKLSSVFQLNVFNK